MNRRGFCAGVVGVVAGALMGRWGAYAAAVQRDPLRTWAPLPVQYAFLRSKHRRRLLRAGNQFGKTTAGAVDLRAHVTGVNPWCPAMETPEPIEAWVICATWSQSVTIQRKIHELFDPTLYHPDTVFDEVRGFRGKNPAVRVRHKSGGYSIVRFKTMAQGGLRLASATIQYAWFDEPPESPRIFSEITKRVMRAGSRGRIILTMTPVNADVGWLQDDVEGTSPTIEDHHARMEPHEFIPMVFRGGKWGPGTEPMRLQDGTPCDATWIQGQIADTLPHEVPVVCHGEWRMYATGAIFRGFRPDQHVSAALPAGSVTLRLGIDHGQGDFREFAALVAVQQRGPHDLEVWVLSEYASLGDTTIAEDAEGVLEALDAADVAWSDLDSARGDKPTTDRAGAKSNKDLAAALTRALARRGHRGPLRPEIWQAKVGRGGGAGSKWRGVEVLHRLMVDGRLHVHPRCTRLIQSLQQWAGEDKSEWKDAIDALRYAIWDESMLWSRRAPVRVVV